MTPYAESSSALAGDALIQVVSGPSQPRLEFLGDTVAVLLSGVMTGDRFVLLDVRTPAGGGIPVLHTHPGAKTVIVASGTYEFYHRERGAKVTVEAPPGTVAFVPDGAPHGYANVGEETGHLLWLADASGRLDAFFHAAGSPVDVDAPPFPDVSRWLQAMATYRVTFVEVPPPSG